jgi:hypothetical protein
LKFDIGALLEKNLTSLIERPKNSNRNLQAHIAIDSHQWTRLLLDPKMTFSKNYAFCVSLAPLVLTQSVYIVRWKYP